MGVKQKKIKRKMSFSTPPILNIFSWKFYGLVLGLVEKIDTKGINVAQLQGRQAVRRNLKKG